MWVINPGKPFPTEYTACFSAQVPETMMLPFQLICDALNDFLGEK
jgi:hypothetical protein